MNIGRIVGRARALVFDFGFGFGLVGFFWRFWCFRRVGDVGCRPQAYLRGRGIVFAFDAMAAPA